VKTVALSEAKDKLSALVDEASSTHEIIHITKHGHTEAVLMSADDLESLEETVRALATPGLVDELRQAEADLDAGDYIAGADLRRRLRLSDR
jgi:prevent-host-death family protein